MHNQRTILTAFGLALLGAALPGCSGQHHGGDGKDAIRVTYSEPVSDVVPNYEYFTGNTKAVDFVEIRARVSGYLNKVYVKEGSMVDGSIAPEELPMSTIGLLATPGRWGPFLAAAASLPSRDTGTLLFEIDRRPYQTAYDKADADLERARAFDKTAELNLARETRLLGTKGASSQKDYDEAVGRKGETAATILANEAARRDAKLNLDFTLVASPIRGRVGLLKVTRGNLVEKDKTVITTVVSLDPMYAYFPLDENTLLRVKELMRQGKFKAASQGHLVPVEMQLADQSNYPYKGFINFVDPEIDPKTGTKQLRGQFANADGSLEPGLFVRTRVAIGEPGKKLLVTDRAVVSQQGKKYLYVVNAKNIVEERLVTVGGLTNGLRVIEEGLTGNERVIINGVLMVRPGVTVDPVKGSMERVPGQDAAAK
jgi:RND family efflux transporter MFP subunit